MIQPLRDPVTLQPSPRRRSLTRVLLFSLLLVAVATPAQWATAENNEHPRAEERKRMVEEQIKARGVTTESVLEAMTVVPRHRYVPEQSQSAAYADRPLPIGHGQTISQPYIVALMTELLQVEPGQKILEIGTGSGYQAAVLAAITPHVYTIEIVEELAESGREALVEVAELNPEQVRAGDGYFGWEEEAPFDGIIVTAAADHVPPPLIEQLRPGGRMVIPVGPVLGTQRLVVVQKDEEGRVTTESTLPVRFVPLTGGPR